MGRGRRFRAERILLSAVLVLVVSGLGSTMMACEDLTADVSAPVVTWTLGTTTASVLSTASGEPLASTGVETSLDTGSAPTATSSTTMLELTTIAGASGLSRPGFWVKYQADDPLMHHGDGWIFVIGDARTWTPGAYVLFYFTGTEVRLRAQTKLNSLGIAEVALDSRPPIEVDLYRDHWEFVEEVVWDTGELEQGMHRVLIRFTGRLNPASYGEPMWAFNTVEVKGTLLDDWGDPQPPTR